MRQGLVQYRIQAKLLLQKARKEWALLLVGKEETNVTVICGMSSSGTFIPPTFIFPTKRMSNRLTKNGPPGALYQCTKNGWTNEEVFLEWLKHFNYHAKPSKEYY